MPGFIFLYRDIANHWVWHDGKLAHRWMDLLIQASWENRAVFFGGARVELKRGQLVTSTRLLMGRWRTNARMVLKVLGIFESDKMIRCKKTTERTIITICNYDAYQSPLNPQISPYNSPNFDNVSERVRKRKRQQIKENNNEEYNNISHQRVREENSFFEELKSSGEFFEQSAMSLHCGTAELKSLLEDFMNECKAKGKTHSDFSDFRNHFFDWARKQINKNGNRQKSTGGNGSDGGADDKYQARRGSGVGNHTAADYGGSFSV